MKIIVKNGQVFGFVENEHDLKVILKAQEKNGTTSTITKPKTKAKTYRRTKKDRWTTEDEQIIMDTVKEEAPATPHSVLFKRLGKLLNRTPGSIAWRFYTLRKNENNNEETPDNE